MIANYRVSPSNSETLMGFHNQFGIAWCKRDHFQAPLFP